MQNNQVHSVIGQYTIMLPARVHIGAGIQVYFSQVTDTRGEVVWVGQGERPGYALEDSIEYASYHAWCEGAVPFFCDGRR